MSYKHFYKSDHTKRFRANDFLWDGLPSQISVTNNKRVVGTFNFRYPHLTLKEGSKVKSDHINRFTAHDFLSVYHPKPLGPIISEL